jgi:hypothetical protein
MRVTDHDLPRATEVLDAYVARTGGLQLDQEQLKQLVGLMISLCSTGISASLAADDVEDEWGRKVGDYMTQVGHVVLVRICQVPRPDLLALMQSISKDISDIASGRPV